MVRSKFSSTPGPSIINYSSEHRPLGHKLCLSEIELVCHWSWCRAHNLTSHPDQQVQCVRCISNLLPEVSSC